MAEATSNTTGKRYAVVTGANKGIGFEICRQLAFNGITVVLTARDKDRGTKAVDELNSISGTSGLVTFHQLDVTDLQSIASLAQFVKSQFGKLDILVNNAGIGGNTPRDADAVKAAFGPAVARTNEALRPLLQLSDSPRIVNISSRMGRLKNIPNESVMGILNEVDNLTEEKIDQLLHEFLQSFKEGSLEANGWPQYMVAYTVSKAAMNAHTRILAKKYPNF